MYMIKILINQEFWLVENFSYICTMATKNFRPKLPVEKLTKHRDELSVFCSTRGRNTDLKKLHPELATTQEFNGISPPQLKFAWYYAIRFAKAQEDVRIEKSISLAFYEPLNADEAFKYKNGNFPEKVRKAIAKFGEYDLDIRVRARLISEIVLYNWEQLVDIDIDDAETDKSQYVVMSKTIISNMPELIKQVENGFGVRESKVKDVQEKFINDFHDKT